jgi:chorismate--pyruvate lyase
MLVNWSALKWQPEAGSIPGSWRDWLLHADSFMSRLKQHRVTNAKIELLQQSWQFPTEDERKKLGLARRAYVWVREVLICSEEKKWMIARTVFPRETLTGKLRCLSQLKTRSLGSVLFKDPFLQRSDFEITRVPVQEDVCWARRSVFMLQNKKILLAEIFLPDMKSLLL